MNISKIKDFNSKPEQIKLNEYISSVKEGETKSLILEIRKEKDEDKQKILKSKLPSVLVSGIFQGGYKKNDLQESTGLIGLDIDGLTSSEVLLYKDRLKNDPYTHIIHVSARGKGLYVVVRYKKGNDFKGTYLSLEKYYFELFGIVLDPICKNINRLRYISYDPDIFFNDKSKVWVKIAKEEKEKKYQKPIFVKNDFENIIKEIQDRNIDLSDDDYERYRALGFALASEFGEGGRAYFHSVCLAGSKYKQSEVDKHYTNFCKNKGSGYTIATFYHYCKEKEIKTYSEETKKAIKWATFGKRTGKKKETVIQELIEKHNIEDCENIVDEIYSRGHNYLKNLQLGEDKNETALILEHIQENFDFRFNEITRRLEIEGVAVNDNTLNSCYIQSKIAMGEIKVPRTDFDSIVFSNCTPTYNPIKDFIRRNEKKYTGETDHIRNIIGSIKARNKKEEETNYLFFKKWFVGMIATSLRKGVSPLALILCGGQRTGKTEWFRRLLPNDLKNLYSESKLDAGKDDEILMTQKILIMDDEFGGKSKKDEKKFKEITSKNLFSLREPYGRVNVDLPRLATLGGTTNDTEVLFDPTGNRRMLPIFVKGIDHELYNNVDKDLLFIQGYKELIEGFDYELTREEVRILNDSTEEFQKVDALEELLLLMFSNVPEEGSSFEELTTTEILLRIQMYNSMKVGNVNQLGKLLKKLEFSVVRRRRKGGPPTKMYRVFYLSKEEEVKSYLPNLTKVGLKK